MWIIIALAVSLILLRLFKPLLMMLFVRKVGGAALQDIGNKAVYKQPDHIQLTPKTGVKWKDEAALQKLEDPLKASGFQQVDTYEIPQLPDMHLRLLVKPEDNVGAAVYEHPKAGIWVDLFTHYADSTTFTITSTPPHGLERRPGCTSIHSPGVNSGTMYRRMMKERPKDNIKPMTADSIRSAFEEVYMLDMSWRKNKGISVQEVANVAIHRV